MKTNTARLDKTIQLLEDFGVYQNYNGKPENNRLEAIKAELQDYTDEIILLVERMQ